MAERITAEQQLARILELLPRASRARGVTLTELARTLEADEREIIRDLTEVYTRSFYQPAGSAEDVQVLIQEDHVTVWTTGEFRRPVRLNSRESLAASLALRVVAAGSEERKAQTLTGVASRLEERMFDERAQEMIVGFDLSYSSLGTGAIDDVLVAAARDRCRCRIGYLKAGAQEPGEREFDPFVLLASGDRRYAVGYCHLKSSIRVFRLDRMISASALQQSFEIPEDFDLYDYVSDGRVYSADESEVAVVRYSARIARWIAEKGPVETLDDGSVLVRYSVADRHWLIRHVLEHGPDAQIIEPEDLRQQIQETIQGLIGSRGSAESSAATSPNS